MQPNRDRENPSSRLVMVVGAGGAIGSAIARCLGDAGYRLVLADIDARAVAEKHGLTADGMHVAMQLDVASESSVANAFASLVDSAFGVVYCVGGTRTLEMPQPRLADSTLDDWTFAETINARGAFLVIREFLRHRRNRPAPSGRIVTIASVAGQIAGRNAGVAYSASKAALLSITRTAAAEAAELQITVNAVSPGPTESPAFAAGSGRDPQSRAAVLSRIPLHRLGLPEEIAATVRFLMSDDAGFITGATLDVNGGLLMRS